MQGMMRFYERNVMIVEKYSCTRPILEDVTLTLLYFLVLVVLYFIPCFSEGAQTIKKKMHTMMMSMRGGWVDMVSDLTCILASVCFAYQHNLELCNILLHLLLLDNYASQQCLEKTKQTTKQNSSKKIWSEVHALSFWIWFRTRNKNTFFFW